MSAPMAVEPYEAAEGDQYIGLAGAGQRIGVSRWTIRQRIVEGLLPGYRTSPTSPLRVKVSDVDALLKPVAVQRD